MLGTFSNNNKSESPRIFTQVEITCSIYSSSSHVGQYAASSDTILKGNHQEPVVKQELLTLPEHLNSPPVFSGVRVTRSLVLCVCFVDRCLSFFTFSFGHCVVCSSSIYSFWLPLWYLQTLLKSFGFPIFQYWAYLMNVIQVTSRTHYIL